jgi:hypothetical protein
MQFVTRVGTVEAMPVPDDESIDAVAQWAGGKREVFDSFDESGDKTVTPVIALRTGGLPLVAWPGQWVVKGLRQGEVLVLSDALFTTLYEPAPGVAD